MKSAKVMYEIYQDEGYGEQYYVVYFTELGDRNREIEINRAMAGRYIHDGFIREWHKEKAKAIIADFVRRLNEGRDPPVKELEEALGDYSV